MAPAVEIVNIPLIADADIENASSAAGKQFRELLDIVAAQKGCQRQYWGRKLEDQSVLVWTVDWDDLSDHHAFMKSEEYKKFFGLATPIFDLSVKPSMIHINVASHPPNAARDAPMTEVAVFAIDSKATEQQRSTLEDVVLKAGQTLTTVASATSVAVGWVVEELENSKDTNGKAIGFGGFIGWPSVEAAKEAQTHQEVRDAIGSIAAMVLPPTPETTIYHAKLVKG